MKFKKVVVGFLVWAVVILASISLAAGSASLFNYPKFKAQSVTGAVLSGGLVYTYAPGTVTPKATYSDVGLSSANTNPIVLDANGEATIYLNGLYDVVLKTSAGVTQWTMTSVGGIAASWTGYEIDVLNTYGGGSSFTKASIDSALTAVGASQATLLLRPGNWTITDNLTIPANVTLKMPIGAYATISTTKTLTINGTLEAGLYQIFYWAGTGKVAYGGKKYPEWWGAKDDSGTTDNTEEIQAALTAGGHVSLLAPNGGYYKITDTLNIATAGTKVLSDSKAEIRQATAAKKAFNITVSNVNIKGLTLTGYQHAAYNIAETAVYATGTDDTTRITDITVEDCTITSWGWEGIRFDYVDRATARFNYLDDIVYSGIQGRNANYTDFSHNTITDITPGSSGLLVGITLSGSVSQATASKHGRIAHNYIYNTGQAILLEPAEHVTITGNDILDCITGIDVKYHTTGGISKDVTVTGNNVVNLTLTTTQQKGIDVAGKNESTQTENVTVTGNTIYGYGNSTDGRGAIQTGAAKGVVVSGNNISNSQKYGILIGSYTDYSIISENNIYGMQTVAGSAGILVGTACDYTAIQHNNIDSGAYVGINVSAANPKLNLRGNVISTTYTSSISGLANCIPALYRETTTATVTGATTGDLKTYTIFDDTTSAGNSIRFEAAGTKAGGTGNKQIDIVLGSTTVTAHAAANNTNDWRIVGTIMFSASNAQQISWACWDGATMTQGYDSATEDTAAADVTLKLSAIVSGAGDTVVQRLWIVEKNY